MTGKPIPDYESLKTAVEEYGEVHAPMDDDEEYELEIRKGQVYEWHDDAEAVTLEQYGDPVQTFLWEQMRTPYCPQEIKHY